MADSYELTYGEVLKQLRDYHGYKQKEISNYLNITSQAYSNYETGKRMPDIETMRKIAQFYRISLDELVSYRFTRQIDDTNNYMEGRSLYRGVSDRGITIPMTAKQAKKITDILSLPPEQQDACWQLIDLFMLKSSMP